MLTTVEKVLLLQDLEIFGFVSTEHLAQLAAVCEEAEWPARETLFRQGEPSAKLHLLVEGQVKIEGLGNNRIVEKTALDFWSFFAQSKHQLTAQTVEKCATLVLSFDDLVDILTAEAEFAWALLKYLARLGLNCPQALE